MFEYEHFYLTHLQGQPQASFSNMEMKTALSFLQVVLKTLHLKFPHCLLHGKLEHATPKEWKVMLKKCLLANISTLTIFRVSCRHGNEDSWTEEIAFKASSLLNGEQEHMPKEQRGMLKN